MFVPMLHDRPYMAHATHISVVERFPVFQRQTGKIRVLLEEDKVSSKTKLDCLRQEVARETLTDTCQVVSYQVLL